MTTHANHRREAEGLIRSVREHGTTADYAVLAVAEAVLELADAVRATTPPRKGPVVPVQGPRAAPSDPCTCNHARAQHVEWPHKGSWGMCRAPRCPCVDFTAVSGD